MTTVNSPACLLARNCFYRHLPPSPDQMKPESSIHNDSIRQKQRQVSLGVTMATPSGGSGSSKGLWVDIILGCSSPSLHVSTSKPNDHVK